MNDQAVWGDYNQHRTFDIESGDNGPASSGPKPAGQPPQPPVLVPSGAPWSEQVGGSGLLAQLLGRDDQAARDHLEEVPTGLRYGWWAHPCPKRDSRSPAPMHGVPKLTEISAAGAVRLHCAPHEGMAWRWVATSRPGPTTALCSRQSFEIPGSYTDTLDITYVYNPQATLPADNLAYTTLKQPRASAFLGREWRCLLRFRFCRACRPRRADDAG